jgi:hypothetical protein
MEQHPVPVPEHALRLLPCWLPWLLPAAHCMVI